MLSPPRGQAKKNKSQSATLRKFSQVFNRDRRSRLPAGTSPATGQRLQFQPSPKTLPSTYRPCFPTSGRTPPGNISAREQSSEWQYWRIWELQQAAHRLNRNDQSSTRRWAPGVTARSAWTGTTASTRSFRKWCLSQPGSSCTKHSNPQSPEVCVSAWNNNAQKWLAVFGYWYREITAPRYQSTAQNEQEEKKIHTQKHKKPKAAQ